MTAPAERMKAMRNRRRALGMREIRLVLPDPRARSVQQRIARQVARLDHRSESEAMLWIEAVSEFDAPERDEAR
jgi:hypothetical protein